MRNTSGLKRGGPGRPKGSPNKVTKELKEWYAELFNDEEYRRTARARIFKGKAPHLEGHAMAVLMPKTDKSQAAINITMRWADE